MSRVYLRLFGVICVICAAVPSSSNAQTYDILITNGTVIDGTGGARYRADVAITGNRIAAVSRTAIPASQAKRVIDASGLIVAPGPDADAE